MPAFSDHEPYAIETWEQEFLSRSISTTHDRITLLRRFGVPANHIVKVAQETAADLIVLAWNQNLDHGHARVVADTLTHCKIPVLLLPARLTPASAATSVASQ